MKTRERWVVGFGGAIVVLVLLMRGGPRRGFTSAAASGSLGGSLKLIEGFGQARSTVGQLSHDLGLTIPTESPGDQEIALRAQLAQLAQRNAIGLTNMRRAELSGPRNAPLKPIQFRLELTGSFIALMNLVYALEHAPAPFLVLELSVNPAASGSGQPGGGGSASPSRNAPMAGGGGPPPGTMPPSINRGGMPGGMPPGMSSPPPGGGGSPGQSQPDKIECSMLVQTHIFPVPATASAARKAMPAPGQRATSASLAAQKTLATSENSTSATEKKK